MRLDLPVRLLRSYFVTRPCLNCWIGSNALPWSVVVNVMLILRSVSFALPTIFYSVGTQSGSGTLSCGGLACHVDGTA